MQSVLLCGFRSVAILVNDYVSFAAPRLRGGNHSSVSPCLCGEQPPIPYNPVLHSLREAGLLFLAAVAGGVINSVAGGGGFICFPALIFTGVPPISANATNTIALWPGTAASIVAYRNELRKQNWRMLMPLIASSIVGGLCGALLLLLTPQRTFMRLVPWLMLIATLLFIFGSRITNFIRRRRVALMTAGDPMNKKQRPSQNRPRTHGSPGQAGHPALEGPGGSPAPGDQHSVLATADRQPKASVDHITLDGAVDLEPEVEEPMADDRRPTTSAAIAVIQLVVAVYIGYFGAGAGIVILALLAVMGMQNIHAMNGIKVLLASSANGIALITFIVAHTIHWPEALLMLCGAILGGYGGAWYAQRLRPEVVRGFVIATGCVMTAYFFWRT